MVGLHDARRREFNMQTGSDGPSRSASARARIAGLVILSVAAIVSGGCTTSDGTLDPAVETLLTTLASTVSSVVAGVVQGIAEVVQPLFTAGILALLF
jgi:hypothetical protein